MAAIHTQSKNDPRVTVCGKWVGSSVAVGPNPTCKRCIAKNSKRLIVKK